ncbi:MAG TPA: YIP1 family protein [Candidatus Tyrphobacter sp.]
MDTSTSASASGFQNVIDVILSPKSAFERLRTAPTWGWAFIISIVLGAVGSYVIMPAVAHAIAASWPAMVAADPRLAAMTPEQQQSGLQVTLTVLRFAWLAAFITVPLGVLLATVVMLIFKAIGRGSASFASLWAASANIAVPTIGLSYVVLAIVVLLRGVQSFNSSISVSEALPSLALLAPSAGVKLATFLATINVFQVWGAVLIYLAMRTTAKVGAVPAALAAIILPLVGALLAAAGAR